MSKKRRKGRHTPLSKHAKVGTALMSPIAGLNVVPVEWERDLLPEYLWIGALAVTFGR